MKETTMHDKYTRPHYYVEAVARASAAEEALLHATVGLMSAMTVEARKRLTNVILEDAVADGRVAWTDADR